MLKIQDLNLIIKYFAAQIQKRIEEIQSKSRNSKPKTDITILHNQSLTQDNELEGKVQEVILKYQNYQEMNSTEVEYVKKMCQRIQQIFGFYKWNCRNQSILSHAERQLSSKLNLLTNQLPLNPTKIMSYIVEISRKGFCFNGRQLNQSQKSASINPTVGRINRKLYSKSETRELKQNSATSSLANHQNSINTPQIINHRRRTSSVMSYSYSNSVHSTVEIIDKLYSCMNIDKVHLSRCIQSENYLTRNQTKRNKSALKKYQGADPNINRQRVSCSSTRKMKTQANESYDNKSILSQIKINSRVIGISELGNQQQQHKKAPVMSLGIFGKKWSKIKTICKKRNEQKKQNNQNNFI